MFTKIREDDLIKSASFISVFFRRSMVEVLDSFPGSHLHPCFTDWGKYRVLIQVGRLFFILKWHFSFIYLILCNTNRLVIFFNTQKITLKRFNTFKYPISLFKFYNEKCRCFFRRNIIYILLIITKLWCYRYLLLMSFQISNGITIIVTNYHIIPCSFNIHAFIMYI